MNAPASKKKFSFGQQIHHKLFDYYGVIVAVDSCFKGDDQWYEMMAAHAHQKTNLGTTFKK